MLGNKHNIKSPIKNDPEGVTKRSWSCIIVPANCHFFLSLLPLSTSVAFYNIT